MVKVNNVRVESISFQFFQKPIIISIFPTKFLNLFLNILIYFFGLVKYLKSKYHSKKVTIK